MTKMRALYKGGPEVFPVGYGAMSFADFYGPTNEENSHAILDAAMEMGANHLDTANVYGAGRSERWIGSYLAKRPEAKDFFQIATKAAITRTAEGGRTFSNAPEHLESELDQSLQRLGVDCVELFYVHRREPSRPIEEVTETLAALVKKGKTKAFGFSEIAPTSLRRAQAVHPVAAVQSEYSLGVRAPELGLVQTCAALGVTLVAFSPVGRSFLTDRPITRAQADTLDWMKANPRFMEPNYSANIAATDAFRALAAEMGVPAAGLANAWLLAQGDHIIPIPGTRSVQHFRESLHAAEMSLSADDLARIETVLPVGWAHGDRYSPQQWAGPERYC